MDATLVGRICLAKRPLPTVDLNCDVKEPALVADQRQAIIQLIDDRRAADVINV